MSFPPPTQKQAHVIWFALTALAVAAMISLLAGLIWIFKWIINVLAPVLWPLAVAGVVAYLLDPVVDYLERRRMSRQRAIITVFSLAFLILAGVFGSVIPQIISDTRDLANQVPAYSERVQKKIESWIDNPPRLVRLLIQREAPKALEQTTPDSNAPAISTPKTEAEALPTQTNSPVLAPATNSVTALTNSPSALEAWLLGNTFDRKTLQSASGWLTNILPKIGSWIFGQVGKVASWFGILAGLALIPVYAFYLLLEKRGIESKWTDYLPVARSAFKDELVFVLRSINDYMIAFFRGQVLVAICDGIMYTIGFLIIGLPYAVLLGFIATFLTLIPYLGAIVTCAIALILAFVQSGSWWTPALVLAVFAVVQTLEGLVISPKIMGDRVGLHPLTIIIAVMAGTTVFGGILGGILAIPLTAVLRVVLARYIWKRALAKAGGTEPEEGKTAAT